jgi:hypothetical protein
MTGSGADAVSTNAWPWLLAVAIALGVLVRADQYLAQVLIDDEWHAVHQALRITPTRMLLDFGHADYGIPLGILYWNEARWFGLSEFAMRWPMLACGLATLAVFPLYVAPRVGRATALVFALLLSISPLLVVYSRMARPYAITLLAGWIAHVAFQRFAAVPRGAVRAGALYATTSALAIWLHPIIAPFVLAPLPWALFHLRRFAPAMRRTALIRLLALGLSTSVAIAALILPPLVANPQALLQKGGVDTPDLDTFVGVWYAWLGTPSTIAVVLCVAFAAYGARDVWRSLPEARTGFFGIVLTLLAIMSTRPAWSFNPVTLGRYLLPFVPLLLLAVGAGAVRVARGLLSEPSALRRIAAVGVALLPGLVLAAQSPLAPMLLHPNGQTLHLVYYLDFRPEKNRYVPYINGIPMSPFWESLAAMPAGSLRIAAAPFYFESYDWDAPRWERASRQSVIPGLLTGLCVERRWGEVPRSDLFRFRNAVHLADDGALAEHGIDYVVWQKPYVQTGRGRPEAIGADTAHCETALRVRFGTPAFEDSHVVAFRVARSDPALPHAER